MAGNSKWNQSNAGRRTEVRPSRTRLVVWAAVGVAFAGVAFLAARYAMKDGDSNAVPERERKPKPIAHVAPKTPAKAETVVEEAPKKFWEVDASQTNGLTRMQMRKWEIAHRPPPGYTNNAALLRKKPAYAIFNHKCENLIAAYLTLKPGDGMIGTPILGEGFRQQFLKSLEEPIIVTAEDSPEVAQLKRDMIATKIDLKARMDEGEDICKIMSDTHKEVQDLARYKSMLQKEVREASKNPDMTMEDVDDLVEAANKMLDAKGIAPIKLGPISRRLIQRRKGF